MDIESVVLPQCHCLFKEKNICMGCMGILLRRSLEADGGSVTRTYKAKPSRDAMDHLYCEEVTNTLDSHEQFS